MKRKVLSTVITALLIAAISIAAVPAKSIAADKVRKPAKLQAEEFENNLSGEAGLTFSWKAVKNAKGYQYRCTNAEMKEFVFKGKTKGCAVDVPLTTAGDYKFQVRAFKKINGKKVYSSWSSIETEWKGNEGNITGGWEINSDIQEKAVTEEDIKRFDEALEGLAGAAYEPVAIIAKQVVAGMNYMYLCRARVVYPDAPYKWTVVTLYQPLSGKAELTNISDINPADIATVAETPQLSGGWYAAEMEKGLKLPAAAQEVYDKAMDSMTGVSYKPIALIATQVVAGTNYMFLCQGTTVTQEPQSDIYEVIIYKDLNGEIAGLLIEKVDLAAFNK